MTLFSQSRRVILIPVIHSHADLGQLADAWQKGLQARLGPLRARMHVLAIEQFWNTLETRIAELRLDLARVRLYQDSLPICERERDIVKEVATKGSHNHRLLLRLMQQGATLTGTESPELLVEELQHHRKIKLLPTPECPLELRSAMQGLLDRRDQFIAERIAATLERGWTGLLFIGMHHAVERALPEDIEPQRLAPFL